MSLEKLASQVEMFFHMGAIVAVENAANPEGIAAEFQELLVELGLAGSMDLIVLKDMADTERENMAELEDSLRQDRTKPHIVLLNATESGRDLFRTLRTFDEGYQPRTGAPRARIVISAGPLDMYPDEMGGRVQILRLTD